MRRHRIAVKRPGHTKDEQGGYSEAYTTIQTVWGNIYPKTGSERQTAGQEQEVVTHVALLRSVVSVQFDDKLDDGTTEVKVLATRPPTQTWANQECDCIQTKEE